MNGILLLDKPQLYTSHDIVYAVRRKTGILRVGHAGTLDPMATGLLVMLLGKATKSFGQFETDEKEYRGMMTLGIRTDTQDLEGKIIETSDCGQITEQQVLSAAESFVGRREQRVPRFSSAKIAGRKCYELMRNRVAFEAPVKTIEIHELKIEAIRVPDVFFWARVSKGTYIRALCDDIGERLGVGAALTALRRVRSGSFRVDDSVTLTELLRMDPDEIGERIISPVSEDAA